MAPRIDSVNSKRSLEQTNNVSTKPRIETPVNPELCTEEKNLLLRQRNLGGDMFKLSLFDKYGLVSQTDNPPPSPNGIDQTKVDSAVASIKRSLSESLFDDVSHGDLKNIQSQFSGLNAAEANAVFSRLSDDEVKTLVNELSGTLGGYSAGEKRAFFNELAGKFTAENLNRLATFMDLGSESSNIRLPQRETPDINILAQAIGENSPDSVKAAFAGLLANSVDKHQHAGAAAAQVLASLHNNPALLEQTLTNLSESQLRSIIDGASRKTVARHGIENYDPEPLAELMQAVAKLPESQSSASLKAKLFDLGASKIKQIQDNVRQFGIYYGGQAETTIRQGLTALINSDTTGVVSSLETTNQGEGLKIYVKSMIATGNVADQRILGEQISKLLRGNDLSQDQFTRFEETIAGSRGSRYYSNAKSLGFYAGAIHAATENIKDDREARANLIKNIFGTAADLIAVKHPVAGAANGISSQIVDNIVKKLDDDGYSMRNALIDATFPRDEFGKPYIGAAKTEWEASFAATASRYDN